MTAPRPAGAPARAGSPGRTVGRLLERVPAERAGVSVRDPRTAEDLAAARRPGAGRRPDARRLRRRARRRVRR
ncbi:ABC transporter ATP-binding protein, partial [Streptomyces sp. SID69]|nr:ABC transporter ATP-binding protein [Streptomyces sp. SID69]